MFKVNLFVLNESFWQPFRLQIFLFSLPRAIPWAVAMRALQAHKTADLENKLTLMRQSPG